MRSYVFETVGSDESEESFMLGVDTFLHTYQVAPTCDSLELVERSDVNINHPAIKKLKDIGISTIEIDDKGRINFVVTKKIKNRLANELKNRMIKVISSVESVKYNTSITLEQMLASTKKINDLTDIYHDLKFWKSRYGIYTEDESVENLFDFIVSKKEGSIIYIGNIIEYHY